AMARPMAGASQEQTFGVDHVRGEFGRFPDASEPLSECLCFRASRRRLRRDFDPRLTSCVLLTGFDNSQ
ncbi:MAG: hypothetical protein WBM63_04735, partial [Sedimenticolaceae bacterium]